MVSFKDKSFKERLTAAADARRADLERYHKKIAARGEKIPTVKTAAIQPESYGRAENESSLNATSGSELTRKPSIPASEKQSTGGAKTKVPDTRISTSDQSVSLDRGAAAGTTGDLYLPPALIESVRAQRAILFLGAGASRDASPINGRLPPLGGELKKLLAEKFFGRDMADYDLMSVAEMAIASHGNSVVYEFIKEALDPFHPSDGHKLIASFRWRMLATTNYDLLIERAYDSVSNRAQQLVKFVKDSEPVEERLQRARDPVILLKLHGSLDYMNDEGVPIVLSHEHYDQYSTNRKRLFSRLIDQAHESPIIFCGYGLGDAHIRSLIYRLSPNDGSRPAYYMVSPNISEDDRAFWAKKNVEAIKASFSEFMRALDGAIPEISRKLRISDEVIQQPIRKHFRTNATESENLRTALSRDFAFVRSDIEHEVQDPKKFYEGYDTGWGGIIQRLDVGRKVVEDLLYRAVFEQEQSNDPRLFVLKGPAGNGKTIALKRAAWEASVSLDQLVLFMHPTGALDPAVFRELYDLTGKRIYLFVDRIALQHDKVESLLKHAKQQNIPITVISAERDSEWNVYCSALQNIWRPLELRVSNLSRAEIEVLIDLLERHGCLGLLVGKPRHEQIDAFYKRADRQLLVALHETTQGKKFEDIVFEEYQDIVPEQAQRLYLDICTLNQFGVPVRAGTMSRVSSIRFEDYKKDFFLPLENIVLTGSDPYTGDFQYKARHSRVATLVFNQACPTDEEKADQLIRVIEGLDIGFSVDRYSLESVTKGRSIAQAFSSVDAGRNVYRAATIAAPDQAFVYQQWAIFESSHSGGSLIEAEERAKQARDLEPRSKSIIHTQAEIARKRANVEKTPAMRDQLRRQSRERLAEMKASNDRFAISSRCKLLVDEIEDLTAEVEAGTQSHREVFFADKVKEAETALERATQSFPDDPDFLEVEARLRNILGQRPKAVSALERAWAAGPRGAGVAIRLSRAYEEAHDQAKAEKILRDALEKNPDDKAVYFALAKHLLSKENPNMAEIEQYLSHSYGKGDSNFEARIIHAQFLFLSGDINRSFDAFRELSETAPSDFLPYAPRRHTVVSSLLGRYTGVVTRKESSYLRIRTTSYPAEVYAPINGSEFQSWDNLRMGSEVSFTVKFNRSGPVAFDLEPLAS